MWQNLQQPLSQPKTNSRNSAAKQPEADKKKADQPSPVTPKIDPPTHAGELERYSQQVNKPSSPDLITTFTGALVIVTVLQVLVYALQSRIMYKALEETKKAANAASAGAQATSRQVELAESTAIAQLRAYVFPIGMRFESHQSDNGMLYWTISPTWQNSGSTPASVLEINTNSYFGDGLPDNYTFAPFPSSETIQTALGPNGTISGIGVNKSGDELFAVRDGKKALYIWGTLRYRDAFPRTPERLTEFLHSITIFGNPTRPVASDNVVQGVGTLCRQHNSWT